MATDGRDMESQCAPYRAGLKSEPYASVVPDRRPEVKYHAGLGRAKNAVAYSNDHYDTSTGDVVSVVRGGEIYERGADGWELLYRVEHGTRPEDLPWRGEA
ncbi:hypothetical protein [Streptomyces tsukubensis]|uniref:hypothetical protein n=1 Tax=Streptomyces tsukubensis TaxID=83656 RepID=UPI00344C0F83